MRDRRKPDEQQETGSRTTSASDIRPVAPRIPATVRASTGPMCPRPGLDDTSLKYLLAR